MSVRARCHYCKRRADTRDHIVPKSLGGPDTAANLVPACTDCNQEKGTNLPTCECRTCREALKRYGPASKRARYKALAARTD